MTATEALRLARQLGVHFTVSGEDQVKVASPLPLPDSLLAALRAHKLEIITLLGEEPDYSLTACTCEHSIGGTESKRCGVCGLPMICPTCSRCRGCKLALKFKTVMR